MTKNRLAVVAATLVAATTAVTAYVLAPDRDEAQEPVPRASAPVAAAPVVSSKPRVTPTARPTISPTAESRGVAEPVRTASSAPRSSSTPAPARFDAICEVPGQECLTAEEAKGWWLPGAFLAPRGTADYVASSRRGGRAAPSTEVDAQPTLMLVFGAKSQRAATADVMELIADGAIVVSGRVTGHGTPPEEEVSGSERRVVVRGRPGVLLAIASNEERPGMRLVTWFTIGPNRETIAWTSLDGPDHRSGDQVLALLNGLTQS